MNRPFPILTFLIFNFIALTCEFAASFIAINLVWSFGALANMNAWDVMSQSAVYIMAVVLAQGIIMARASIAYHEEKEEAGSAPASPLPYDEKVCAPP